MSEKPIIFSTPMVRAILEGRKTQTRRVIVPQPSSGIRKSVFVKSGLEDGHGREIKLHYQPGDILWVRETWCRRRRNGGYGYKADRPIEPGYLQACYDDAKWRSSIHMPREAARLFLRVTDVRVERLQDISEEDVVKEGFTPLLDKDGVNFISAKGRFHVLWDSLNAKRGYGWDTNPWVWVIEFERV